MLEQYAQSVEPGVLIVEPRMFRRIIRLDRRIQGFPQLLSRRETYPIERNRLLALVDSRELGVRSAGSMPERLVLLARPEELDADKEDGAEQYVRDLARRLFHACVHLELDKRFTDASVSVSMARERRSQLGEAEFAEIQGVLLQDDRLFPASSDVEVYIEFVASYLEMHYFAPEALSCHFPGVRDWSVVDDIVRQDIDHQALLERMPLRGWVHKPARGPAAPGPAVEPEEADESMPRAEFRQLQMQAERAAAAGNQVKAALLHATASVRGPREYRAETRAAACAELEQLAWRLRDAVNLSDAEVADWARALQALLVTPGERYQSIETRLLYDLQKVCVEHERRVHRTSIWRWIVSRGRRPCERPLPLLGETLILRHLQRAQRRVSATRVDAEQRERLAELLEGVWTRLAAHTRERLRRIMTRIVERVGLRPGNVPERVAREKMTEELMDRILERGYISMADVRDALSKNDLKLPDVAGMMDFLRGDLLLKVDRALGSALEGVYRRGTVYQRWPQMLSSLAFGTRTGRFLTRFLAVPYGGAYLALACLRHLRHSFTFGPAEMGSLAQSDLASSGARPSGNWLFVTAVFCLGTWVLLLVHRPTFRHWCMLQLKACGRYARRWLIELPTEIIHSRLLQRVLGSYAFRVLQDYVLRPVFVTFCLALLTRICGVQIGWRTWLDVGLVAALLLNSAVGRFVDEVTMHRLTRLWRDLRIHVIGSLAQWTMDLFRGLITTVERIINLMDEWLRLRRGNSRLLRVCKTLAGMLWFVVAYVVVFVFTLLVEPQINPIKHFPVVTVSHKLILPAWPVVVQKLSTVLGTPMANTLVGSTIWLVPGVFGFLVWELKENWRLYRANRPPTIRNKSMGSHGETMLRLLRPGFHSGTLPKAFATLRRAFQGGESVEGRRCRRMRATIRRVEIDVRRFVERELLRLLADSEFLAGAELNVSFVQVATNRVVVEVSCAAWPADPIVVSWEYTAEKLVGEVWPTGWVGRLGEDDRATLGAAVSGLFQHTGVDEAAGPLPLIVAPPFTWEHWVCMWQRRGEPAVQLAQPVSENAVSLGS